MQLLDWIRSKITNAGSLLKAIGLFREFSDLINKKMIEAAEDKAIEIISLWIPSTVTVPLDKLLDALVVATYSGIDLFKAVKAMLGQTMTEETAPKFMGSSVMTPFHVAEFNKTLDFVNAEATKVRGPTDGSPPENPLVIIAVAGLLIQVVEFIIKRRRERRENPK